MAHKKHSHHGRHHLTHAEEVKGGHDSHHGHHFGGHGHKDGRHQHKHGHHKGMVHAGHHSVGEVEEGERQGGMNGVTQMGRSYYGAGHGDFANMPREVKMEMYPRQQYGVGVDYPDTYDAINEMQGGNERHMQSQRSKEMY